MIFEIFNNRKVNLFLDIFLVIIGQAFAFAGIFAASVFIWIQYTNLDGLVFGAIYAIFIGPFSLLVVHTTMDKARKTLEDEYEEIYKDGDD